MIKDGSHVSLGCLIGERVVIGPDATLDPYERLSVKRGEAIRKRNDEDEDEDDDDSDIEEVEASELDFPVSLSNLLIFIGRSKFNRQNQSWERFQCHRVAKRTP